MIILNKISLAKRCAYSYASIHRKVYSSYNKINPFKINAEQVELYLFIECIPWQWVSGLKIKNGFCG